MILIFFCVSGLFAQKDENSSDIKIFQKYEKLENACLSGADSELIALYQKDLYIVLEKELEFSNFPAILNKYDLKQKLQEMQEACLNLDMQTLSHLITIYFSHKKP